LPAGCQLGGRCQLSQQNLLWLLAGFSVDIFNTENIENIENIANIANNANITNDNNNNIIFQRIELYQNLLQFASHWGVCKPLELLGFWGL
jgi:ankyrin repeat protein